MNKARILIVEDEAIIAVGIESQLQGLGYEVTSIVDTGERAIQKAEADKPDLILMDIRIKGEMDGIDTAEVIRNKFGIPVIFSTAYLDQERTDRAKITMPFGYVLKPLQERDLKVTIEMALYAAKVEVERKRAEQRLIENEKQYHDLFNSMLDGFALHEMIFDDNGKPCDYKFLKVNPAFERLTGLRNEDIAGKSVLTVLPNTEMYWIEKYSEVVTTGSPITFENYAKELDKYYEVNAYRPAEGQFACVFTDITKRKLAEERLTKSEKKHREILEGLNDTAYRMSLPEGKYEYMGKSAKNVLGYYPEEILNYPMLIREIIHPDYAEYFAEKWTDLLNGIVPKTYEYKIIDPDGHEKWILQSNTGVYDDQNNIVAVEGLCRDITKQKEAEKALRKSEEKLKLVMDGVLVPIVFVDSELRYNFVNKAYTDWYNTTKEEIEGKYIRDLITEDVFERALPHYHTALSGKPVHFENRTLKEGKTKYVSVNLIPHYKEDKVVGFFSSIMDITNRKMAEEERKKTITQLQEALETVKKLSGLLPICANCKKIRDDKGYWNQIESYVEKHSDALFSHSICPECLEQIYPKQYEKMKKKKMI